MAKRHRVDTAKGEAGLWEAEAPKPPEHIELPENAEPVWQSIVRARDYTAWTQVDLEHAANLACCLADLERLRREIRAEGDVIENARGTPVMNPKHTLVETLSRRSVALSRLLHVHAEATEGESRDSKKRSTKQREVQGKKESLEDDDLIYRPTAH